MGIFIEFCRPDVLLPACDIICSGRLDVQLIILVRNDRIRIGYKIIKISRFARVDVRLAFCDLLCVFEEALCPVVKVAVPA